MAATLILSDTDRDALLAALENPPEPNERLLAAARLHRDDVVS